MVVRFSSLSALEILDSRAQPTVWVQAQLAAGPRVCAGVPSGASTGSREAVELRDHTDRYHGRGVERAVANVNGPIADMLIGPDWSSLAEIDLALRELDGTPDKSRLGANAIVGVSMAAARGFAAVADQPLWQWLTPVGVTARLPVPYFNVINGGVHAPNPLDFQEFMIAPQGAPSLPEAMRAGAEIYAQLRNTLSRRGFVTSLGDEGGFAPDVAGPEDALVLLTEAIDAAGYRCGRGGVTIALDPAASEFYREGRYLVDGQALSSQEMIDRYRTIIDDFPVSSIEDGLAETDHEGWRTLTESLGERVQLVGDDNFVTCADTIAAAARSGIANAALIKVNQVGTVSETLDALHTCRTCGYGAMVSHRSGETIDAFIADLAVGSGFGQIKSGAPARGERSAKYNRLLDIAAHSTALPFGLLSGE
ncbi:phosphopyruvate hydratase [Mycobacterium sp. 141]|uniref:phosphopyruvate hydratase n=1 Tax=Mycobacterium sp. 141 TaxID=1120797 RepID=UPI00036645FA|nr:phosphopyruvate hydratase [Mycobacterium sp. 141]